MGFDRTFGVFWLFRHAHDVSKNFTVLFNSDLHQPGNLNQILLIETLNENDCNLIASKMNALGGVEAKVMSFTS